MPRPNVDQSDAIVESWEITTGGTVWVWVYDRREDRYSKQRVGGRAGSRRIHITRDDRKFNQEQIPEENSTHDPFTNGTLILVDAAQRDDDLNTRYHLTQEDLLGLLEVRDEDLFHHEVDDIKSELILRRLSFLAEKHGQMWQIEYVRDRVERDYKSGGTQRTVREMLDAQENLRV